MPIMLLCDINDLQRLGSGEDLDLLADVRDSSLPFEKRGCQWSVEPLPVPAEILVYTESEGGTIQTSENRFSQAIQNEAIWIFPAPRH